MQATTVVLYTLSFSNEQALFFRLLETAADVSAEYVRFSQERGRMSQSNIFLLSAVYMCICIARERNSLLRVLEPKKEEEAAGVGGKFIDCQLTGGSRSTHALTCVHTIALLCLSNLHLHPLSLLFAVDNSVYAGSKSGLFTFHLDYFG